MRLPPLLNGMLWPAVIGSFGALVILGVLAFAFTSRDSEGQQEHVARIAESPAVTPSSTGTPSPAFTPTAAPVSAATQAPDPDRTDCNEVRGTPYRSDSERAWFLGSCVTPTPETALPVVAQAATASSSSAVYGSGDRIAIPKLGVDAPITVRVVGPDAVMENPLGAWDVVWYDFRDFRGLGGYPGAGGNASFAGHVDYHSVGPAVFWSLRSLEAGDVIEYYTAAGDSYRYLVQWARDYSPNGNWSSLVASTREESITLITCGGTFDTEAGGYTSRRVVRATRAQ